MDPIRKLRYRLSQGRRSSVDPVRFTAEDSCLMATEEKKPRSGIPRIVAPSCSKRRSSSSDRTFVSKSGYDGTLASGSVAGLLFTPQNPVTPRVSLSARKAIDCISQLSAKCHTARKDQRTALDKNAQLRLSRHVASFLNKTGLVGDLLAGGQGRAPSGPIQSSDLKNMNKNVFITLFNLLFKKLGSRRKTDLTSSNYHESIPMIAKKLGYPGLIYKSHLLAPNTSHSWPYVIAFLGWMVDLVEWQQPFEEELEGIPKSEPMAVKELYVKSYAIFINEGIQEPLEENIQEFRKIICDIKNTQPEVMEEVTERRNKLKSIVDAEEGCLNSFKEQIEREKAEVQEMIAGIENLTRYNANLTMETKMIKEKINEAEAKKVELVSKFEQLKMEKESLKIICSKQRLTKPTWDQMVAENKVIRGGNQMLAEMCDQTKKLVDSLDVKIISIRSKLHKVWFEIDEASMSVQSDSTQVAHLMKLMRNFSYLESEAHLSFEEILRNLHDALDEITSKVAQDEAKSRAMQDVYHEINIETNGIRRKREQLMKDLESLRTDYKLKAQRLKEEEDQLRGRIQEVRQKVNYIREISLGDCNVELEKAKEMYKEKLEALERKKHHYASILCEMQEISGSYLKIAMEKMLAFHSEAGKLSREINKFKNF